jgi:tRNA-2-methylthio-N6-dimethylallyladenosine synthase
MIFGPQTLHRLPNMLNDALSDKAVSIDISFPEIFHLNSKT